MKKLAILSMTAMFLLTFNQLQAKAVKNELLKTGKETSRKELKLERKENRNLEENSVANLTKDAFYADFGDVANVNWENGKYFEEAVFSKDGKQMKAYYDNDNKLVGTTQFKTFADIPARAQKQIKAKYKGYTVGKVVFFKDNEANDTNMIMYDTQFEDADNYFVELSKANKNIILQVNPEGEVFFFEQL